MNKYQQGHYEGAARIVASFIRIRMTVPGGATGPEMAEAFADAFAADNPLGCAECGRLESAAPKRCSTVSGIHRFTWGFDRERFLTSCGLD